jgi:hypothetical protein
LPPPHVIALCGGRRNGALIRTLATVTLLHLGSPGDLPSGERLRLIF